jgi:hypothetical protein
VSSVFQGPAVLAEAADGDTSQHDGATVVGAVEYPSRCDAVALGDLLLHSHPQALEDREIEEDRFASAVIAVEGRFVDVIDEVGAEELLHP